MPRNIPSPKKPRRSAGDNLVRHSRINPAGEVITRDKLVPFFENVKDLIVSTAKGTETVLTKEIRRVESELHLTQKALKLTKDELNAKIDATKDELRAKIDATKDELKAEIKDTETRLSDKIDAIHIRQDDHETRISALETTRP